MTEPRWTVDAFGEPMYVLEGRNLADITIGYSDLSIGEEAYAALVQCVRDADTLRKAREIARQATSGPMFGTHDPRISGIYRLMELLTEDADGPLVAGDPHHNPKD